MGTDKFIKKSTVLSGAAVIGVFAFLSRLLGFLRDRIFAGHFGAGDTLDIYFAAFRIPDLIFNLVILGAFTSAFVPVFTNFLALNKKEEAFKFSSYLFNIALLSLLAICGVIYFLAPSISYLIAPGFSGEKMEQTIFLTRIMLLSPVLFGLSNIASGILNSYKKFFVYSLAPIFYNLGIIIGAVYLEPKVGISGLAWGVVLGAALHMLIQFPSVIRLGFRFRLKFNIFHEGIKKLFRLMIPSAVGLGMLQLNLWVITVIASMLQAGSVAIFNFANNLQSFPIGIFGISFAISSFPYLAEAVSRRDTENFRKCFSQTFIQILFFVVPISMAMLLMRAQIVRLVLGTGEFDWEDTILTAEALGYFSLSLFAQALIPLLTRSFYSMQDTRTPVIISIISMGINVGASLFFARIMGVGGLALGFSIASFINLVLLLIVLRVRFGDLNDNKIISYGLRVTAASLAMAVVLYSSLQVIAKFVDMQTFVGVLLQTVGATLIGGAVYLGFSALFKLGVSKKIFKLFKFKQHKNNPSA